MFVIFILFTYSFSNNYEVDCNHSFSPKQNNHDYYFFYSTALCLSVLEWRQDEVEHINATLCGAERKAALCALLEQETQFIASIERHRISVGERNHEKSVQAFLNKVLTFSLN